MRRSPVARWVIASLAAGTLVGCALPWNAGSMGDATPANPVADASRSGTADGAAADLSPEERAATEDAVVRLEQMAAWLAEQPTFQLRADVSYDAVQANGERIEFGGAREIVVERPDRLRIDVIDRDGDREILAYDGEEVWMASPTLRAFAHAPQVGPVDAVIERLAELDSPLPLADLVDPGLGARLRPLVRSAARVGFVRLDGETCEQIAYRMDDIDFQLFVETGDAPIPRRMIVDYREAPGRPQFRASLREWDLRPRKRPRAFFQIHPPIGAQRLELAELLERMREVDERVASGGAAR